MKINTNAKLSTIAKMLAKEDPVRFMKICNECEPMLLPKQSKLIPEIYAEIKKQNPDIDRTDESIMFAVAVCQAFAPAIIESQDIDRMPHGIRPVMCNVMEWNNGSVANHYLGIGRVYFKGKSFKERVMNVLNVFQGYSEKSNQTQLF